MTAGVVSARFDGTFQSTVYTDAFNTPNNLVDGRFLGNARLSYTAADKDWQVSLEVQNIFNRCYYGSIEDGKSAFGAITAAPGLPRTWAVSLKRTF